MRPLITFLTVLLFFIWILPLGYFVKPSQQKTFCDGQRGMCMCSVHFAHKSSSNPLGGITSANPNGNKEAPSSGGGGGNYFESGMAVLSSVHSTVLPNFQVEYIPSLQFVSPIEHVPRF